MRIKVLMIKRISNVFISGILGLFLSDICDDSRTNVESRNSFIEFLLSIFIENLLF